jgi:hypothetical protein
MGQQSGGLRFDHKGVVVKAILGKKWLLGFLTMYPMCFLVSIFSHLLPPCRPKGQVYLSQSDLREREAGRESS